MDSNTLVNEEISAGAELIDRFDQHVPVLAAFWLKEAEASRWYLYITSDAITDVNLGDRYRHVLSIAREMANPNLNGFQVKLIPASDPLARAVVEFQAHHPAQIATYYRLPSLGGVSIEGAYLYPPRVPAASQ